MKDQIICRVLTGPTASGKTGLSIRLAGESGFEIISMDSMQIYRRMDIGTAKPTQEEQQGIPHHMLDILEPTDSFSVAAYRDRVEQIIREVTERGKQVLFVGGTGLYLDALAHPMAMGTVPADAELREKLNREAETPEGRKTIHDRLEKLDPDTAARLPVNDIRRVIRAIEVSLLTGIPFSKQPDRHETSPFVWRIAGLMPERKLLYARIEQRVDEMIRQGLADEVRELLQSGVPENAQSMSGLGYKEMIPYLKGDYDLERAAYEIKLGTRHYAKRQVTYMKREENTRFFDPTDPEIERDLKAFLG